jgi:hypothetical protein
MIHNSFATASASFMFCSISRIITTSVQDARALSGADSVYLVLAGDDNNAFLPQAKHYRLGAKAQLLTGQVDEMGLSATGDSAIGMIGSTRYPAILDV